MPDITKLAGELYTTYSESVGGIAFNGDPLPSWDEFSRDVTKQTQASAWIRVAQHAVESLQQTP